MADKISYEIELSTQRAQAAVDKLSKKLQEAANVTDNGAAGRVARAQEEAVARVVRADAARNAQAARFAAQREAEAARWAQVNARAAAMVAAAQESAAKKLAAAEAAVSSASPAKRAQAEARLAAQRIASANQVATAQQNAAAKVAAAQVAAAARYDAALARQRSLANQVANVQLSGAQLVASAQARAAAAQQQALQRQQAQAARAAASQAASAGGSGGGLGGLGSLGNAAGAAAAIEGVRRALMGVYDATVKLQAVQGRLRFANNGDTKAAAQDFAFITANAERLGLQLADVGDNYSKFAASSRASGVSLEDTRQTFLGVAEASKALGLSNFDSTLVFQALTQMTQKGVISLEEFRGQMGERLPIAMKAATNATGLTEQQFIKLVESGKLLSKDFLPGFGRELRALVQGELPNAVKTMESEANRLGSTVEALQQRLGQGELGKAMSQSLGELNKALKDNQTTEAFDAIAGGFAILLKAASENLPKVGGLFTDLAKSIAKKNVYILNDLDRLTAKFSSTMGLVKERMAGSIFFGGFFDNPEATAAEGRRAQNAEKEADARAKERIAAFERRQKELRDAAAKEARAQAALNDPRRVDGSNPAIGDKKPFTPPVGTPKGDGDARSKANAIAAARKSFETAKAEAQSAINESRRREDLARLQAALDLQAITYEDYVKRKSKIENDAIADERRIRTAQLGERQEALKQAQASGDQAAILRAEGDVLRLSAALQELDSQAVVIDIELKATSDQIRTEAERVLAELDQAFAELQGDSTSAAKARNKAALNAALKDPKNQDPAVQAALRRNAAAEDVRIDYDKALADYEKAASQLAAIEAGIQADLSKGLVSQLGAELAIDDARQKAKKTMEEQLAVALKLAEATKDPKAIEAIVALRRELDANVTSAQAFQKTVRDGLLNDARKGFADVLQGARSLREVLLEISVNYLQKQADRFFDLGVAQLEGKGKNGVPAGYEEFGTQAGNSFISAIQSGWSTVQNLFSGLADMLTKALSGLFSGGGGGGGFLSGILGAFTGSFGARLAGGGVESGRGYIVGERGPEVFFPGTSGTVVTSKRLEQTLASMLQMKAPQIPKLTLPSFAAQAGGGSTNVNVAPRVVISGKDMLSTMMELPEWENAIVQVAARNRRKITGG